MEFTSKKVGSPRRLVFKRSGPGGFTVSQNTEDPNNIPWVPYKMKLVATEIFPHFIKNPLVTTNDIRLYIEASTIHYGTDTIPLVKLLDDDKRLPEDALKNLRSHHPLFGGKSYSLIEDFVDGISVAGGYGTCMLETWTEHFLREQESLRKERKKHGVIVVEGELFPPKKSRKIEQEKLHFKRAFVVSRAGKCAARHFLPMMFMDFAHMRNSTCEKSVVVSMLDGNGRSTPIGYGICEAENKETWCWALECLKEALSGAVDWNKMTIITYGFSGIEDIFAGAFPKESFGGFEHARCCIHLLRGKHVSNKEELIKFWKMARTPSVTMYNTIKEELDDSDDGILSTVKELEKEKINWAISQATLPHFSVTSTNPVDIFNGVFVKERGFTALGFLYTLVTYTEERLSELEKKMNSEKVAGNTTDLTPDAYKKYMVNSSYADLINETDIKSITVEGDKLSCVVCSSWAEVVVVLKDCNFDGVLDSKRFVHGLYCSCGKTKDTLIPCQHLIKVLRYCAKIKFCDASIQKRVPVVLKHEFLKQGYSGWKENYTGVENIFHLKSRRLVGQSSKSYSKRKRRYEKKGKARGQRAELEKEKRTLEQSRLAMNRKEFLERLIKEVDSLDQTKKRLLLN